MYVLAISITGSGAFSETVILSAVPETVLTPY